MLTVLKFGGTSVKDAEAFIRTSDIIISTAGKKVVVVSALAGITDDLTYIISSLDRQIYNRAKETIESISLKHKQVIADLDLSDDCDLFLEKKISELKLLIEAVEILGELTGKSKDLILSFGECMSSTMLADILSKNGIKAKQKEAGELIITDSEFTEATVLFDQTNEACSCECKKMFDTNDVIVVGGFIGSDLQGRRTTLGRGGSDYSASVIAAAIKADLLEIWTDVDGILTSDPRLVRGAKLVTELSYIEASELAFFGAKVLHPKTIRPAVDAQIPVVVKNSYNPKGHGTVVVNKAVDCSIIKAIAYRKDVTVINIRSNRMLGAYGFLSKVFEIFKKHETSVDLVTTTEVSISLTIDDETKIYEVEKDLAEFSTVEIFRDKAIISAIGEGIRETAGIAARFFNVLKGINVSMVSVGASEVNLSIVIEQSLLDQAVMGLHEEFFGDMNDSDLFKKTGESK